MYVGLLAFTEAMVRIRYLQGSVSCRRRKYTLQYHMHIIIKVSLFIYVFPCYVSYFELTEEMDI
jgi:hypothetical protein